MPRGVLLVAAGVVCCADRILVCRRRPEQTHPLKWEFPGGKAEPGENVAECLRRELREELDIEATLGSELWRVRHQYPGGPLCEVAFVHVPRFSGTLANRCFGEIDWSPVSDLGRYDFLEADREFVRLLSQKAISLEP